MTTPRVWLGPDEDPDPLFGDAIREGGGQLSAIDDANAIVWLGSDPSELEDALNPDIEWVQLHAAGVSTYVAAGLVTGSPIFTSAAGAFSDAVAEHALGLAIAGLRELHQYARAQQWKPSEDMHTLRGASVAVVGAGGIGKALIDLLHPFGVEVIAVNRSGEPVDGADRVVSTDGLERVWGDADVIVLAVPETEETRHMVGRDQLTAMRSHAVLVNVGRGTLIETEALVDALAQDEIGCAAVDVTDPEPLPGGHPLWSEPRCLLTPHVANFRQARAPALARRIRENVTRFAVDEPLVAVVDPERGY